MIRGMTGFGRAHGQASWGAWVWEVRSVNGKAVDLRTSLPFGCEAVEFEARRRVKERFARGSFQLQLKVEWLRDTADIAIDPRGIARLARLSRNWSRAGTGVQPARLDGILSVLSANRSTARTANPVDETVTRDLLAGLDIALEMLIRARSGEGANLRDLLLEMLADIERILIDVNEAAAKQPGLVRERLKARLADLSRDASVDADRLAQEILVMATRADVREEADRLSAHIATARSILASGEAAGRKLDFLCQEFNREANTLCSKSASLELTNSGLALKSVIDQFREQVQNVE